MRNELPIHRLILFLIISLLLLTVAFLWGECGDISFDLKINDDKVDHYFTSFAALTGTFAIIFIYLQYVQSIQSNKPNLLIKNDEFELTDSAPTMLSNGLPFMGMITVNKNVIVPYLEVYNIGLGNAKDVKLNWVYDKQAVIQAISNTYYYDADFEPEKQSIQFIPKDSSQKISLPNKYLICCGIRLNGTELEARLGQVGTKPKLQLRITFKDIADKEYSNLIDVIVMARYNRLELNFNMIESKS